MSIEKILCYIIGHMWGETEVYSSQQWRECVSCGEEQVYSNHFGKHKWGWLKAKKESEK